MCEERNCCCFGPQGPMGPMGLQGSQGIQGSVGPEGAVGPAGSQGPKGDKGDLGSKGDQGPQGIAGPQGVQGLQGLPGKDCIPDENKSYCCESYCNIWAQPPQILGAFGAANDSVLFQFQNAVTAADFDLTMMSSTGEVKFLKSGVYRINYGAEAKVSAPIPVPVPSFSFGLWKNNVIVPGSTISGFTQAGADDTLQVTGEVMLVIAAGDIFKLRNASSNSVDMTPNTVGIVFPVTVATMNISCLKSLP
jgi:hypothetical protein